MRADDVLTSRAVSTDEALLAAVRDEVIAYGVRRATATSIAQRAGVSRMTVYRRGGGVRQLLLDALTREFDTDIAALLEATSAEHGRARLVDVAVSGVRLLTESELVTALRRHDPELLLPYLVDRHGHSQQAVLALFTTLLEAGLADGSIRPLDVPTAAVVLLHAVQDFVVSAGVVAGATDPARLEAELTHLVDAYLAPAAQPKDGSR